MNKSPSGRKCFPFGRHWPNFGSKRFQKKCLLPNHRRPRRNAPKQEDQEIILMTDQEWSDRDYSKINQEISVKGKVQDDEFSIEKIKGLLDKVTQNLKRIAAIDQVLSDSDFRNNREGLIQEAKLSKIEEVNGIFDKATQNLKRVAATDQELSDSESQNSQKGLIQNTKLSKIEEVNGIFDKVTQNLERIAASNQELSSSDSPKISQEGPTRNKVQETKLNIKEEINGIFGVKQDLERISANDQELSDNTQLHMVSSTASLSDGFVRNRHQFLNDRLPFLNFDEDAFEVEDGSLENCGCDCQIQNSSTQASFRKSSNEGDVEEPDETFIETKDCDCDCQIENSSTHANNSFGRSFSTGGVDGINENAIRNKDELSNHTYPHFKTEKGAASTGFNLISGLEHSLRDGNDFNITSAQKRSPRSGKCRHLARRAAKVKLQRKPYYKHQHFGRVTQKCNTRRTEVTETKVSKEMHRNSPKANCSHGFSLLGNIRGRNLSPRSNLFGWKTSQFELENHSRQDYPTSKNESLIEGKHKEKSPTNFDMKSQATESHKYEDDNIHDSERNSNIIAENEEHDLVPKAFVHADIHAKLSDSNKPVKSANFESLFHFNQISSEMFKKCRLQKHFNNPASNNNPESEIYGSGLEKLQPKSRQPIYIKYEEEVPESTITKNFHSIPQADLPIRNPKKHPNEATKCNKSFRENNCSSFLEPKGPTTHNLKQNHNETACLGSESEDESIICEKTPIALLTSCLLQTHQSSKTDANNHTFVCTVPQDLYLSSADSGKRNKCQLRRQKLARLEKNKRPWKLNKNHTDEKYRQVAFEVSNKPCLSVSERVEFFNNISESMCGSSTTIYEKSPNNCNMDNKKTCTFPNIPATGTSTHDIYGNYDVDSKYPCTFPCITNTGKNTHDIYKNYDVLQGNFSQFWNLWEKTLGVRTPCLSIDSESLKDDLRKILDEKATESSQSEYKQEEDDDIIVPYKEYAETKCLEEVADDEISPQSRDVAENIYSKPKNDIERPDNILTMLKSDFGGSNNICEKNSCTVDEDMILKFKEDLGEATSLNCIKIRDVVGGIGLEKQNDCSDVQGIDLKTLLMKLIHDADEISSKLEEVQDDAVVTNLKLAKVPNTIDGISSKLEEVQEDADEFNSKLEEIQINVNEINSKLEEVQDDTVVINLKLAKVPNAIDEISSNLEDVDEINSKLEQVLYDNNKINSILEEIKDNVYEISLKLEIVQDAADEINSKLEEDADEINLKVEVQESANKISLKLRKVQNASDEIRFKLKEVQDVVDEINLKLEDIHSAADAINLKSKVFDVVEDIGSETNEVSRNRCTRLDTCRSLVKDIHAKITRINEHQKPKNVCGTCKTVFSDSKNLNKTTSTSFKNLNSPVISSHTNPRLKKEDNSDIDAQANKLISRPKKTVYQPQNRNVEGTCSRKLFFLAIGGLAFLAVWSFLMKICSPH